MKNNLLQESFDLIKSNTGLTSESIPLDIIDYWKIDDPEDVDTENDDAWTIFMYAFLKYKKEQGIESFEITTEELMKIFVDWQFIINLAFIHKVQLMKISPFPLLDFDNMDELEFEMFMD